MQASGPAREDHLHARQPHGNAGLAGDAAEDPEPLRCASRLLRSFEPQQARGHEFFSTKNIFVVGLDRGHQLRPSQHSRSSMRTTQAHSIEILNPADDAHLRRDARTRLCRLVRQRRRRRRRNALLYCATKAKTSETIHERTALERSRLPQLFEYLEEITATDRSPRSRGSSACARCSRRCASRSARTPSPIRPAACTRRRD